MIKIENTEVVGWEHAIRGMRNPKNSWIASDSGYTKDIENEKNEPVGYRYGYGYFVGDNDLELMQKLCKAGTDHRKFMRMIVVYADITAPLYWWKEFDTYKVGTVANSCSTMHKIHEKEFTLDDFSCEHLAGYGELEESSVLDISEEYFPVYPKEALEWLIELLNQNRKMFIETKDKRYWWQMIQMLPSSYNQKRTVMLNYEVLANIYKSRRNHKLDEWVEFCKMIETLPHSEFITGKGVAE